MEHPDPFLAPLREFDHEFVDWCHSSHDDLQLPYPNHASYSSVLKLSDIASALPDLSRSVPSLDCAAPELAGSKRPRAVAFKHDNLEILSESDEMKPLQHAATIPASPRITEDFFAACKRPRLSLAFKSSSVHEKPIAGREGLSQREIHIHSERQRRRSMTESFTTLQSLVPKLKLKHTDRITVLTEVIAYIESLRDSLEELECKKSDIMTLLVGFPEDSLTNRSVPMRMNHVGATRNSSNVRDDCESTVEVTVRLSGRDVFVTLTIPKHKGVWSRVLMFLYRCSIDVVSATLTTSRDNSFHCLHGKILKNSEIQSSDLHAKLEQIIVKEIQKQSKL